MGRPFTTLQSACSLFLAWRPLTSIVPLQRLDCAHCDVPVRPKGDRGDEAERVDLVSRTQGRLPPPERLEVRLVCRRGTE